MAGPKTNQGTSFQCEALDCCSSDTMSASTNPPLHVTASSLPASASPPGMPTRRLPAHPIHRRLLAEQLLALRRSTEGRRYASAQRSGRIDANPHQVDAVIFALGRVREGGCILADEVGLGKTIEAGLVLAQLRAEGASRVLLVAPKALLGQW